LSALDDEAAGTWLVSVTESTEAADGVLLAANCGLLCDDGVALDVGADEEVVDEVVV
jgi:hypothetical protein